MDLKLITEYINYKPWTDDPRIIVDNIIALAGEYMSSDIDCHSEIYKAYEFARQRHGDQMRLSGEIYIVHLLLSTKFLMMLHPDIYTIQACILHDILEDTDCSYDLLCQNFGIEVADICEGVTKVSKLKYRGEQKQIETLKKTFFAMSRDLRVIFVKLADRIHNIQTLGYHPKPEKIARIANETMTIYVAIAKRLGLYEMQNLLENGSYRRLEPERFEIVYTALKEKFGNDTIIQIAIDDISKLLNDNNIKYNKIKGRLKSIYRICSNKSFDINDGVDVLNKVLDLLGIRVIVDDIGECYHTLGVIHSMYTPMPGRVKDFISTPVSNGYQSIHTGILGLLDFPVEIQIRTPEMDYVAEYGAAAHFAYSDAGSRHIKTDQRIGERVKKLQDIVSEYKDDNQGFTDSMNIELLDDNIFIYTPKGDVIELPHIASVLDFAFRIHSEVGLRYRNAIVNGNIVPIDYQLHTGDVVSIETWKNKYTCNQNRLNCVHSPSSKSQINKFIRNQNKDVLISRAKDIVNEKLSERNMSIYTDDKSHPINAKYKNNQNELESKLVDIAEKRLGVVTFLHDIYPDINKKPINISQKLEELEQKYYRISDNKSDYIASTIYQNDLLIDGQDRISYILCPDCSPMDRLSTHILIARIKNNNIKVHTSDCGHLKNVNLSKLLAVQTKDQTQSPIYHLNLELKIYNKPGGLSQVVNILNQLNINISNISFVDFYDDYATGYIQIQSSAPSKFAFVINNLQKYSDVVEILSYNLL